MKRKKRPGPSSKDHEPTANNDQETTTTPKSKLGRRGFLKIGAGAAAVTLANPLESIAQRRTTSSLQASVTGECNDVPFTEPTKVYACASDGKSMLNYELNAEKLKWAYVCPGNPPTTNAGIQPVFNGALPGPSLYIDRGATLNLTLNNRLNGFPDFKKDNCPEGHHGEPDKPACFQHTNLHFHGFQVSPSSLTSDGKRRKPGPYAINATNPPLDSSDDVLVDVYPGYSNKYHVVLPDMHAPGTNWYHSHMHGASAFQVSGGMAGAIIIREPTDKARIVREDLDKVFLLQEIMVNPVDPAKWPDFPPIYGGQPTGGKGFAFSQFFVNGLCRPTLKMKQGQMMRWRFINAGVTPKALTTLRLVKSGACDGKFPGTVPKGELMHLIAIDGLSFYGLNPQPVRYHLMGLGNRADFLVKFDQPGLYTLLKDAYPLDSVKVNFKDPNTKYTTASGFNKAVLMYIDVEASEDYKDEIPHTIPGDRPAYLNPIVSVDKVRDEPIKFQNMSKAKFQIDNAFYPVNQKPVEVDLNTAEEWTLQNWADYKNGAPDGVPQSNTHPFHVHLNPFQIVGVPFDFEVDEADLPSGVAKMDKDNPANWPFWDTIALPGADKPDPSKPAGKELKIWSRFLIYDGEYVTHCHILVHEDAGMMINVKINGNGKEPGEAVHDYPDEARKCIERTSKPRST